MGCERVIAAEGLRVSPDATEAHLELRPEPRAARDARAWVRKHVPPLDEDQALALEVLTSEVVTNAILHARTRLTVGVTPLEEGVLITVADRNLLLPEQQPYSESRPSGRGITLLREMSEKWGVWRDEDGKIVWFVLKASGHDAAAEGGDT